MNISAINNTFNKKLYPQNQTIISFKRNMEIDNERIDFYISSLEQILYNRDAQTENSKKADQLFQKLQNENDRVKAKFLIEPSMGGIDPMTPFECAITINPEIAVKIWQFVKSYTNYDQQGQFLLGNLSSPESSAFIKAIDNNEIALADDILSFVDKFPDLRLRKRFFNLKSPSINDSNTYTTQYDYLISKGMVSMADHFQSKAIKYQENKNNGLNPRNNENPNKCQDINKKVTKSENYRVYNEVKTRFSDIGGMFNVKHQIENELLSILKNPNVKNSDKPGGIILYGPPGTGKTLLATAIAGEAGVPFISTEGSSFTELYVGSGALNVRKLYQEARSLAQAHPSKTAIVFIDEVDAVGAARGNHSNSERDTTLNALLCEMDGVKAKENDEIKIITIMATNRKDMLDSAFRKGRIDLEFKIDDPRFSEKARFEILKINAKDKPFETEEKKNEILKKLAKTTSGFSGAELADIIKRAFRKTLYLGRINKFITTDDLNNAKLEAMVGISNDSENTEFEKKTTISHEAGHAINLVIMDKIFGNEETISKRPIKVLDLIVNDSRGNAAGLTFNKPSETNGRITIESLISSIVVTYGGYSIEEKLYGCHTDGVSSDLEANTEKIFKAITTFGLGSKTKYLCVNPNGQVFDLYKSNIKKDIETYSNTGMSIANKIADFAAPFIKSYTEEFLNSPVKVIKGEKFIEMFENWLKTSGKEREFNILCKNIKQDIVRLRNKMQS